MQFFTDIFDILKRFRGNDKVDRFLNHLHHLRRSSVLDYEFNNFLEIFVKHRTLEFAFDHITKS